MESVCVVSSAEPSGFRRFPALEIQHGKNAGRAFVWLRNALGSFVIRPASLGPRTARRVFLVPHWTLVTQYRRAYAQKISHVGHAALYWRRPHQGAESS